MSTSTIASGSKVSAPRTSKPKTKSVPAGKVAATHSAAERKSDIASSDPMPGGKPGASTAVVSTPPSADSPHFTEKLHDGSHVIVRPLRKSDAALERAFIKRLSPESQRLRFLGLMNEPSDEMIRKLTDIDYRKDMAFVALVHRDNEKREIGVSRYSVSADGQSCECAVAVDDEWHKKGLGSMLMRHLIDVARARGIRTMTSLDAATNWQMRDLAAYLGFRRERDPDDSTQVIHRLAL
jgi:GNAT superfamily N-acetyltransferase